MSLLSPQKSFLLKNVHAQIILQTKKREDLIISQILEKGKWMRSTFPTNLQIYILRIKQLVLQENKQVTLDFKNLLNQAVDTIPNSGTIAFLVISPIECAVQSFLLCHAWIEVEFIEQKATHTSQHGFLSPVFHKETKTKEKKEEKKTISTRPVTRSYLCSEQDAILQFQKIIETDSNLRIQVFETNKNAYYTFLNELGFRQVHNTTQEAWLDHIGPQNRITESILLYFSTFRANYSRILVLTWTKEKISCLFWNFTLCSKSTFACFKFSHSRRCRAHL